MTAEARAFLLPEDRTREDTAAPSPLAANIATMAPETAYAVAQILAQVVNSGRQFALRARWRASDDDSRAAYANGAADAVLAMQLAITTGTATFIHTDLHRRD